MTSSRLILALTPIACLFTLTAPVDAAKVNLLETKVISHEPQFYNGWPTVGRKANGELWVAYSGGRDWHVCPLGRIEAITSRDNGKTWTWPRILMDSATDDRDAGIIETAKGSLILAFFTSTAYLQHIDKEEELQKRSSDIDLTRWHAADKRTSDEEKKADVGNWILRSEDGGITWSSRLPAPCTAPHGPINLADGRLLYVGKAGSEENGAIGAWESSDDGKTWQHAGWITPIEGHKLSDYHELHAVQAADGSIVAHIRNHTTKARETLQTVSKDGGKTWSTPVPTGIFGFPSHLIKLSDDRLLVTYSWRKQPYGIRGRVSSDNGNTWSEELVITDDGPSWDLGYPSTVELEDKSLITVWYEAPKEVKKAVIRQASWKLE